MSLQLTHVGAKRALEIAQRAIAAKRSVEAKGEKLVERAFRTVEVSGSAFVLGVVQGAGVFKGGEILKVPVELAAGLLFHGLNLLGFAGRHADHLANFGDGGFASYLHVLGRGVGQQHWGSKTAGEMSGDLADRLSRIAA